MFNVIQQFFTRSISRLVMSSFVFVLLLPLGFLASSLPDHSWGSVKDEVLDKHLLIAKSTGETIRLYFSTYQKSLQVFAHTADLIHSKDPIQFKNQLNDFLMTLENVDVLSYVSLDNYSKVISVKPNSHEVLNKNNGNSDPFLKYLNLGHRHSALKDVSPVFKSTVSKHPVVLVKAYVYDKIGNKRGVLFAEVDLAYINDICGKINFGSKEYCSIVDSLGKVVAHPNQQWVEQSHNLSKMLIVQKIKRGKSETMDFFSPYLKEQAVAGFATVEKLGWGVIVSQSEADLNSPLREVMYTILKWLILGVFLALIVAYMLTLQITKPLSALVLRSKEADIRSESFNLGALPKNSPLEISQLWAAISSLVSRLQKSNKEVKKLNYSLSKDIEKATAKLRQTNKHLYKISSRDHLTKIANRRYFEDSINKVMKNKRGDKASIILIDVDKFKFINDTYGHEAGDLALIHIAQLMNKCTRDGDLPARLGGDEFVIYIRNCGPKSLHRVAENLRKTVEESPIVWAGKRINLTLSVGTVNHEIDGRITLTKLLKYADLAMYDSKERGRNHVSAFSFKKVAQKKIEINKTNIDNLKKIDQLRKQHKANEAKLSLK